MGTRKRQRDAFCSFCRKHYRDVGPLVEGPGDIYICGECIELCESIITQEKRRRNSPATTKAVFPSPETVRGRLDKCVNGQQHVNDALVKAALRHYQAEAGGQADATLLIGPSPSSKMLLVRALAQILEVPFTEVDADTLGTTDSSAAIEPFACQVLLPVDFDLEAVHRGMVYVDRIEEAATQRALLRRWEAQPAAIGTPSRGLFVDAKRLFFVCGGLFPEIDAVLARLGRHPEQPIPGEALSALGVTPDLAKRFQTILRVPPLDEENLSRVVRAADFDKMFLSQDVPLSETT